MDQIDIEDIESFIDGLKISIDSLEGTDPTKSRGFQAQIAKAISALRIKKSSQMESNPKFIGHFTKEDLKNFLLNKLEFLNNSLDSGEFSRHRKFNLVLKIAKLRAEITSL